MRAREHSMTTPRRDDLTSSLAADQPLWGLSELHERQAERVLVADARSGSHVAFAQLVERYGRAVISVCFASTLNQADAEELSQDVFLTAWRGLDAFRGDAAFSTWLFAIARNACVDRSRRAAARPRIVDHPGGVEALEVFSDDAPRRTARAIMEAAGRLTPALRETFLLRDLQGFSYEEISDIQNVPIGTVRSRLSAARTTVAKEVGG